MLWLGQAAPTGALCTCICSCSSSSSSLSSPLKLTHPKSALFSKSRTKCIPRRSLTFTLVKAEGGVDSASAATKQQPPPSSATPFRNDDTVFVGEDGVPLEGVIQFEKPDSSSRFQKLGGIALLAGGDVLALLVFAAIGRFSHGFSVFDVETLRTADPFVAGWFLSAYFLGGYGEEGRGMIGLTKAVTAAAKSWALGIPLGLVIRAVTQGHLPPTNFILVTMGSTAVLLIGWRTLLFKIFPNDRSKKDDMYRRGNPFELFEV
ncbi:hypothetical protein Ancab_028797 [Ancistrocladus abbreviatus]